MIIKNFSFCALTFLIILFLFSCDNSQYITPGYEEEKPSDLIENGTPVSNPEEFLSAIEKGGDFYLIDDIILSEPFTVSRSINIEGNMFYIRLDSSLKNGSFVNISGSNISIRNVFFSVSETSDSDEYLVSIGGDKPTSNIELKNIDLDPFNNGLAIDNAENVVIDGLQISSAKETMVSIASSENVEIRNFGAYNTDMNDGKHNIILIRGIGNNITPSTVKFSSADSIESIFVEAVETTYVAGRSNIDNEFEKSGVQSIVTGLDDYTVHYIDEPVNDRRGWFYEKEERNGTDVYDLDNPLATSADLLAALESTKTNSGRGYTLINMHLDLSLTLNGDPLSIPQGVLLCLYDNKLTINGTVRGNSLINVEQNSSVYLGEIEVGSVSTDSEGTSLISLVGEGASVSSLTLQPGKSLIPVKVSDVGTNENRVGIHYLKIIGSYSEAPVIISSSCVSIRGISAEEGSGLFPDEPTVVVKGIGDYSKSDLKIQFDKNNCQVYVECRAKSYDSIGEINSSMPSGDFQTSVSIDQRYYIKLVDYPISQTKGWLIWRFF